MVCGVGIGERLGLVDECMEGGIRLYMGNVFDFVGWESNAGKIKLVV